VNRDVEQVLVQEIVTVFVTNLRETARTMAQGKIPMLSGPAALNSFALTLEALHAAQKNASPP